MVLDQGGDDSDNENKSNIIDNPAIYDENYDVPKIMWDIEKISDWSHRVTNYNEKQKEFYQSMVPKIQELKAICFSKDGWDVLLENRETGVKVETKTSVRGFKMVRGQG